jgi:Kef-type K+ transport system membrane component KefB
MNYFLEHLFKALHLPLRNNVLVFSLLLFIILLSPIVLRKLKIPSIIGLIIAGALIGPKGFQLIGEKFLESEGSIKLLSTIGLLYIMFMAGLELDMAEFKKNQKKNLVFGFLTFIIPLSFGYPICRFVLHLSETASWLTASMFSTHTLVAYPIIAKLGLSKHKAVAITFGGTILTDTAVLIILAIISSSLEGELNSSFWIRLGTSLIFFTVIMFFLIPRIAKWFFSKLESEKSAHYIFVLSIMFFSAFLAEIAGVEHIIGAFVAGLVLNPLIPHSSTLMNRIEFMGNTLFIPFFLISVGMIIDYKAIFTGPWALFVAGVLTIFAITSKWLAAFVMQQTYKMTRNERQIIFGLSTSHAAATLAIIIVGYNNGEGILNIDIVNGTIILILVTCLTSSFVTEHAGKKLLIEQAERNPNQEAKTKLRNQHLLLAINKLKGNENLLDFSVLISNKKVSSPISIVSVLPNNDEAEYQVRRARNHLDEILKHYASNEVIVNPIATIDHNLSSGIARVSKEIASDMVLVNDAKQLNILKRIVGDSRDHLLDVCNKTILFCSLEKPAIEYDYIVVVCPKFADLEKGFSSWAERIMRLAIQINKPIRLYSSTPILEKWKRVQKACSLNPELIHIEIDQVQDFFVFSESNSINQLIIFCSSRNGMVSYSSAIDNFLLQLETDFQLNDTILIYPGHNFEEPLIGSFNATGTPLTKGIEKVQQFGKEMGQLFKKD